MQITYTLQDQSRAMRVAPQRQELAAAIDKNQDQVLSDAEILDYVQHDGCRGYHPDGDAEALLAEAKHSLLGRTNPALEGYHSYEAAAAKLAQLEQDYPQLCQRVSLGKTAEGRDIWALRISEKVQDESTSQKPGVVITGCHHAREWMSVEIPLHVADQLVTKYGTDEAATRRLQEGEIWIIPIVNPDGYEYSRTKDPMWRKNRAVVGTDAMGQPTSAIGVDLNRNYWDGREEHYHLYRPEGDTPNSTWDDFSATSDNPKKDTYRGNKGGSEVETQAVMNLAHGRKNIRGLLNHHSYGNMILHPWGITEEPSERQELYREIGKRMNEAMNNSFTLQSSADLYPASGDSDDVSHMNNLIPFTLEVGRSFQPPPSSIAPTCEKVGKANLAFIDEILARSSAGTLPQRV